MKLKQLLLLISILISGRLFSQEINLGGSVGFIPDFSTPLISFGGTFEFRPNETVVSFNFDPFLLKNDDKFILTAPLYLKYIIGKKLRFCPVAGGFVRTNGNRGFLYGVAIEYFMKEKYLLFVKGDRYLDFYTEENPDHFGGTYQSSGSDSSLLFSIGFRKKIK